MKQKALLVGINYPGTSHALNGCVNDVVLMSQILKQKFGFRNSNVRLLTDNSASTRNILHRLEWLVAGAEPGDVLFFHYSGHGAQIVDTNYDSDVEPDGMDEILCPIDLDWREKVIKDEQLKAIFDKVPRGVNLTVFLDCCHSGSGIDSQHRYQPFGLEGEDYDPLTDPNSPEKNRFLPTPADIASRGAGLNLQVKPRGLVSNPSNADNAGLLISGCQSSQTSADAYINRKYQGAATYFLAQTLAAHNYNVDHKTIIDTMNKGLSEAGYTQRPELNGDPGYYGNLFLRN